MFTLSHKGDNLLFLRLYLGVCPHSLCDYCLFMYVVDFSDLLLHTFELLCMLRVYFPYCLVRFSNLLYLSLLDFFLCLFYRRMYLNDLFVISVYDLRYLHFWPFILLLCTDLYVTAVPFSTNWTTCTITNDTTGSYIAAYRISPYLFTCC